MTESSVIKDLKETVILLNLLDLSPCCSVSNIGYGLTMQKSLVFTNFKATSTLDAVNPSTVGGFAK